MEEDLEGGNHYEVISKVIAEITEYTNHQFSPYIPSLLTNEEFNNGNKKIIFRCIRAVGVFGLSDQREYLKYLFTNLEGESFREEIIRSLSYLKNEEDLVFFEEIVNDDFETKPCRWIAVIALKEYPENQEAIKLVETFLKSKDVNIKSRAIYVMGFMNNPNAQKLMIYM